MCKNVFIFIFGNIFFFFSFNHNGPNWTKVADFFVGDVEQCYRRSKLIPELPEIRGSDDMLHNEVLYQCRLSYRKLYLWVATIAAGASS